MDRLLWVVGYRIDVTTIRIFHIGRSLFLQSSFHTSDSHPGWTLAGSFQQPSNLKLFHYTSCLFSRQSVLRAFPSCKTPTKEFGVFSKIRGACSKVFTHFSGECFDFVNQTVSLSATDGNDSQLEIFLSFDKTRGTKSFSREILN